MKIEDCFEFGYVAKVHGYKGEVVLVLDVDDPSAYKTLDSVFVHLKGKLVPYFVEALRPQGDKATVKLEDVDSQEAAQALVGNALFLPLNKLPQLAEDQFYYHDIIGYRLVDATLGALGEVTDVYELPQQAVIAMNYQGKEVLVPISDEIVLKANHAQRELEVNLPEG
ncbi:MAG TPA: ribosome maturation factor RimM, partial [Cytophagales bacterium]